MGVRDPQHRAKRRRTKRTIPRCGAYGTRTGDEPGCDRGQCDEHTGRYAECGFAAANGESASEERERKNVLFVVDSDGGAYDYYSCRCAWMRRYTLEAGSWAGWRWKMDCTYHGFSNEIWAFPNTHICSK